MTVVVLTTGTSWTKLGTVTLVEGWGSGGSNTSGSGLGGVGGAYTKIANPTGVGSSVTIVIGSTGTSTNWNSGQLIATSGDAAGAGGLGSGCTPSSGAFSGGTGLRAGGGGSAGPDGAGGNDTPAGEGGIGDNTLGGAGGNQSGAPNGVSNVLGGGGSATIGSSGSATGGVPGGGSGWLMTGAAGSGQLQITYTPTGGATFVPISKWPLLAPILAQ